MKVAVCVIGRQENRYAVEFVEYYKKLGVDKIFIYDNNHGDEEHFEEVLNEYINSELVEVVDWRDKAICQLSSYQDCYDKHNSEYDWICFFDFDEYLYIEDGRDIKEFLSSSIYKDFDLIHVNWMIYDDNDLVYYEDKPLNERFTRPKQPFDFHKRYMNIPENALIKSIVRGCRDIKWTDTPHTPISSLLCCDVNGITVDSNTWCTPTINHNIAWIKHFQTKSIEEFYTNKVRRGYPDGNKDVWERCSWLIDYFKVNNITEEKQKYIDENVPSDISIFVCTHKSFESKVYRPDIYKSVYGEYDNIDCDKLSVYKCSNEKDEKSGLNSAFWSELYMLQNIPSELIKDSKYIGVCHYRRYFAFMNNAEPPRDMLDKGYVIVTRPIDLGQTVREQYAFFHNIEDFDIMENIIKEHFAEYYDAFEEMADSRYFISCNMVILPKDYFLKWIKFISDAVQKYIEHIGTTDILKHINDNKDKYIKSFYPNNTVEYQYRIGGYLAERLTHVFLRKHFDKIAFVPMIITESKYF